MHPSFLTSRKQPLRHWQIKSLCPVLHFNPSSLNSFTCSTGAVRLATHQIKNMPPLCHRQVMKSYPRRNKHALLASLTGNQSCALPFLTSRRLPLRDWQIKRSCLVLHLPRNGASRIKQTDLSVRLKGRNRRGSAPMFMIAFSH